MRVVNFLLAIMFLGFSFLQLNDPDPVIWILIYGVMAVTCIMAMFEYYSPKVLLALIVIYSAYSLLYIPGVIDWLKSDNPSELFSDVAKMAHPYIEESREFLGLLICIAVLLMYYFRSRKRHA
ncbi:MAG TPA: transmembrane 220 family protein [Ohtaekwangia sp.]|uniref:transmembrane 220 family protein n=1 Tax=Ohtaekwangia sp. TaxID=2066019 RepID=UPI002F956A02